MTENRCPLRNKGNRMRIQVEFEAQLRTELGQGVVDLDIAEGSSIVDALQAASAQGPESFSARVFLKTGPFGPVC